MVIGVSGRAHSGKDTVCDHLAEKHGIARVHFADRLKNMCIEILGLTDAQCFGDLKEVMDSDLGQTPRQIFQFLGTDVFRSIKPDVWICHADKEVDRYLNIGASVLIADIRFVNELQYVRKKGGAIWRVKRPDHGSECGGIDGHPSETELDSLPDAYFDAVLSADSGQTDNLISQADFAYEELELKEKAK